MTATKIATSDNAVPPADGDQRLPALPAGVQLFEVKRFGDQRGFFSELYAEARYRAGGLDLNFCQDNVSCSVPVGTIRGLHFQYPPFAQDKLVIVLQGAILDVLVDLRPDSPKFGTAATLELSAENGRQLLVPKGFAHGFCTLQPNTMVFYKVTAPYAPNYDAGIHWADPDLAIDWPVAPEAATVSDKDARLPRLRDLPSINWSLSQNIPAESVTAGAA
jgi:dTDP-4-dehydrorhamnose 3,5-epimerase